MKRLLFPNVATTKSEAGSEATATIFKVPLVKVFVAIPPVTGMKRIELFPPETTTFGAVTGRVRLTVLIPPARSNTPLVSTRVELVDQMK